MDDFMSFLRSSMSDRAQTGSATNAPLQTTGPAQSEGESEGVSRPLTSRLEALLSTEIGSFDTNPAKHKGEFPARCEIYELVACGTFHLRWGMTISTHGTLTSDSGGAHVVVSRRPEYGIVILLVRIHNL